MFDANFHSHSDIYISETWKNPSLTQHKLPLFLRQPMKVKGSLTQYIETHSGQKMHVHVLREAWEVPLSYESRALHLKHRERAWIRQVILSVNEQQWVYARSVIPKSSLSGQWKMLKHLHQKPLGSLLFKRQKITRGVICIGKIQLPISSDLKPKLDIINQEKVWARYSTFTKKIKNNKAMQSKKMLVSEYFLEKFMDVS